MRSELALTLLLLLSACGGQDVPHPEKPAYVAPAQQPLSCVPNLDGQIDSNELTPALNVTVRNFVNPAGTNRTVDLVGQVNSENKRVWDFGTDYADDQVATFSASALSGKWFASAFPNGQFVVPLDAAGTLQGIYRHDTDALRLLGIASTDQNPAEGQTLLVYATPVQLFRFPLKPGDSWVTVGQVSNGTIRGLPYAGRDTYEQSVDGSGELVLPDLTFTQALRVRTHLTTEPAVGSTVTRRQTSFLFECFGEVARATSADGETNPDFTNATELRRLGL